MDSQTLLTYGSLLVGTLGAALSVYFFRKGREAKKPCFFYATRTDVAQLLPSDKSEIEVRFRSVPVPRISTTFFWLWNKGSKPIRQEDLADERRLELKLASQEADFRIVAQDVLQMTRKATGFSVAQKADDTLLITFKFLDKNDGALVEVQHTGTVATRCELRGVILGVPEGPLRVPKARITMPRKRLIERMLEGDIGKRVTATLGLVIVVGGMAAFTIWSYFSLPYIALVPPRSVLEEKLRDVPPETATEIIEALLPGQSGMDEVLLYWTIIASLLLTLGGGVVSVWWRLPPVVPAALKGEIGEEHRPRRLRPAG